MAAVEMELKAFSTSVVRRQCVGLAFRRAVSRVGTASTPPLTPMPMSVGPVAFSISAPSSSVRMSSIMVILVKRGRMPIGRGLPSFFSRATPRSVVSSPLTSSLSV
jgi:hypothetical protein